jgi:phosphohistidine phosphatase
VDVYLVRHAIAEPRGAGGGGDDARRELTAEGRRRLREVASGLGRLGVEVDLLLSSPFLRAWQTAVLLSEELGWPAPEALDTLVPSSPPEACLDVLRGRSETSIALVGHEPALSELASLLLTGARAGVRVELRKAGVACIGLPQSATPGSGVLRWSAGPRILRRLGG